MKYRVVLPLVLMLAFAPCGSAVLAESAAPKARPRLADDAITSLSKTGEHFSAMVEYFKANGKISLLEKLAAAKSAWTLGLNSEAEALWNEVLATREFKGDERRRTMLSKAIIKLQEEKYQDARSIAEEGMIGLESSDLRVQFLLLIGEALLGENAQTLAEEYYRKANAEASGSLKDETNYLLGKCQRRLGKIDDARYSFTAVTTDSQYSALALRELMEIDFSQRAYDGVRLWVQEARKHFPGDFHDAWTSYALIASLVELGNLPDAEKEFAELKVREREDDPWLLLAEATMEASYFRHSAKK